MYQKISYNHSNICREEFLFLSTCILGLFVYRNSSIFERQFEIVSGFSRSIFFDYISSFLNSRNGWRVGRWTSNSKFFKLFNQTCFCISWRMILESLSCQDRLHIQNFPYFEDRKHTFLILLVIVIVRFHIEFQKPIEFDNFSCSDKLNFCIRYINSCFGFFDFSWRHLWSDCSFSDKIVESFFLCIASGNCIFYVSRSDTFMSFLRSFGLSYIIGWLRIVSSKLLSNLTFTFLNSKIREIYGISSHVGNQSSFV